MDNNLSLTEVEKQEIQRLIDIYKIAELRINEFIEFLRRNKGLDNSYKLSQDLSKFVKEGEEKNAQANSKGN